MMRFLGSAFLTFAPNPSLTSHCPNGRLHCKHLPGLSEVIQAMGHIYTNLCFFLPVGVTVVMLFFSNMPHIGQDFGAVLGSHCCGQIPVSFSPRAPTGISFFSSFIPHTGQSPSV